MFGLLLAGSGGTLLVIHPDLVPLVTVVGGLSLAAVALVLAGRATSVGVSLVQVVQAVALVPAAAVMAGTLAAPSTLRATVAVCIYLVGSVLLVRSMIRARGNGWFLAASIAFHAVAAVAAAILLPWPYAVFVVALLARAVVLPVLQARLATGPRPLRPIHIGLVEIVASTTLVVLAFAIGF